MRLFFAINFSDDARSKLRALRDELCACSERGNFSAPENLHLTLAFLGECDAGQLALAKMALSEITFRPFDITIDRIGRFRRNGGDIWWAGLRESEALLEVQRDLTARLIASGFELERRKYTPHITFGREVVTTAQPRDIAVFGDTVSTIELMKSERIRGKLCYTAIASGGENFGVRSS